MVTYFSGKEVKEGDVAYIFSFDPHPFNSLIYITEAGRNIKCIDGFNNRLKLNKIEAVELLLRKEQLNELIELWGTKVTKIENKLPKWVQKIML